jgi:NAD(P)-dependent dehydrogenase (short-subunit alcohol dehydrogenase family)
MRTALVTGANRGIGLATARALAGKGMRVVLACRSMKAGATAAAKLRKAGADARAVEMDLTRPESIEAALAALAGDGVTIDALVNNAGIYPQGDLFQMDMDTMREAMEVHFFGPLALAQALVPGMVERNYGRVVNVSSGYGSLAEGVAGPAAYSLSKAALHGLTIKLAAAVRGNVRVNGVDPGWVQTRMGGAGAPKTVEEGADTIVWLATLPDDGPNGGFFRDRKQVEW